MENGCNYESVANVKWVRHSLRPFIKLYRLIQDCIDGEHAVKKQREKYLPKPNANDVSEENKLRYDAYILRSVFYNVTSRTLRGLVGQVFNRDAIIEVPTQLEPIVENIDGSGITLIQSAQKSMSQITSKGRGGLFIDYPATEGAVTVADLEERDIRSTVHHYEPENIINWRSKNRGSKNLLSLVVLKEEYEEDQDGFEVRECYQYRVLKLGSEDDEQSETLNASDVYSVEIWRCTSAGRGFELVEGPYIPRDSSGSTLNEIPFIFVGSENNDTKIDYPPMYDIASLNIAHYRNSADYEESCYMVGQPTPFFSGLTEQWVEDVLKGTIQLGSRGAVPLPDGAQAGLLQASPNQLPMEAMQHKEKQMVALGARLVEQKMVERTATEVSLERSAENSTLAIIANNVSAAYEYALKWVARFEGVDSDSIEFKLNTDFDISKLDAQEQAQLIEAWQKGAIAWEEVRERLRRSGVVKMDNEQAKDLIQNADNYIKNPNNPEFQDDDDSDDSNNDDDI